MRCPILSSTSPPLSSKHSSEARLGQCKVWWTSVKPKTVETSVQSSIQHDQVGVALLPVCFLPAHWLPTIPAQMNGDQRSVEGANILSDWRRSSSPTAVHWKDKLGRWIFLQWRMGTRLSGHQRSIKGLEKQPPTGGSRPVGRPGVERTLKQQMEKSRRCWALVSSALDTEIGL